jgi:hypothetical protein
LNITNSKVEFIYNGSTWEIATSTGTRGYSGSVGYTGSLGYTGSQGYTGSASTVIGYTGSKGDIGYTGSIPAALTATSLALGGATLGTNNLAVSGTSQFNAVVSAVNGRSVGDYQVLLEGGYNGYSAAVSLQSRTSSGGTLVEMGRISSDGEAAWNTTGATQNAYMRFYTTAAGTSTERMRITSAGNLCVGTTAATGRLNIVGGSIYNSTSGVGNTAGPVSITIPSDTDGFILLNAVQSGVGKVSYIIHYMNVSGTVTCTTVSTLVTGTSPITAITPGTNVITLTLFAANTNVNWGMYNGPRG